MKFSQTSKISIENFIHFLRFFVKIIKYWRFGATVLWWEYVCLRMNGWKCVSWPWHEYLFCWFCYRHYIFSAQILIVSFVCRFNAVVEECTRVCVTWHGMRVSWEPETEIKLFFSCSCKALCCLCFFFFVLFFLLIFFSVWESRVNVVCG